MIYFKDGVDMADITMCGNSKECPDKNTCYRHCAKESWCQSYANFYKGDNKKCDEYIKCEYNSKYKNKTQ